MYCTWYVRNVDVDSDRSIGAVQSEHVFSYSYQLFEMASTDMKSEDFILLKERVIRSHHVFKDVWTPWLGEILRIGKEAGSAHNRRAVAVLQADGTIVGHVPREFSRVIWYFLSLYSLV